MTTLPERRFYPCSARRRPKPASARRLGDLYAVIGEGSEGRLGDQFYWNPLVPWLWLGSLVMVLGAFHSLSDRRHRVGAPVRARLVPAAAE